MADKEITMVIEVDLECERCKEKITRVLDKIQDKMNINMTISFDEKRNEVTISGPFDAAKVRRNLCCKAGRIIKDIKVVIAEEKEKEKEKEQQQKRKPVVVVPAVGEIDLRPLLKKMLERPKAETRPCTCKCGCSCGKQTTRPPAQAASSVWPAPATSVSGHVYDYETPSSYYGVPVYSIEGWY